MKGISIIIPTYNRQKFIEEAIQSVFDQEYDGNLKVVEDVLNKIEKKEFNKSS